MKKYAAHLFAAAVTLVPLYASADGRCEFMVNKGVISPDDARSSNEWGVKCKKITRDYADLLNKENKYAIYLYNGCTLISTPPKACDPCDLKFGADAACKISIAGTCTAGCYTPDQQLQFDSQYMSIEEAYQSEVRTVTALSAASHELVMSFAEQPIKAFVSGQTDEPIFTLATTDGQRLEVTGEHPMVAADGRIVPARSLQSGDALLGSDGDIHELRSVASRPYRGVVWNLTPVSQKKIDNVIVAQGLLTGSGRFQNEWANEAFRLGQRDELDVSGL